jgi:hypothetical protein
MGSYLSSICGITLQSVEFPVEIWSCCPELNSERKKSDRFIQVDQRFVALGDVYCTQHTTTHNDNCENCAGHITELISLLDVAFVEPTKTSGGFSLVYDHAWCRTCSHRLLCCRTEPSHQQESPVRMLLDDAFSDCGGCPPPLIDMLFSYLPNLCKPKVKAVREIYWCKSRNEADAVIQRIRKSVLSTRTYYMQSHPIDQS